MGSATAQRTGKIGRAVIGNFEGPGKTATATVSSGNSDGSGGGGDGLATVTAKAWGAIWFFGVLKLY